MMKKPKKLATVFTGDKRDSARYLNKIRDLIRPALPRNILGMLASAQEQGNHLVFNKRWCLGAEGKNNYYIYDLRSGEIEYKNIALFSSAIKILWHLNRSQKHRNFADRLIYSLDQKYYRCLEDIKFFKSKISKKSDKNELYVHRLSAAKQRLLDIKNEISKIY